MIDWNKSAELNSMSVDKLKDWLGNHPKSQKNVVAICDECGKERKLNFHQYRDLCSKCVKNTPEARAANSKARNDFFRNHPEARDAARLKSVEQFSDKSTRSRMSEILKTSPRVDKMRGGNDMVGHHVAYDLLRPESLVVKITRTFHGKIHHPEGCKFGNYGYSLID